jgi:hypothetical protein
VPLVSRGLVGLANSALQFRLGARTLPLRSVPSVRRGLLELRIRCCRIWKSLAVDVEPTVPVPVPVGANIVMGLH